MGLLETIQTFDFGNENFSLLNSSVSEEYKPYKVQQAFKKTKSENISEKIVIRGKKIEETVYKFEGAVYESLYYNVKNPDYFINNIILGYQLISNCKFCLIKNMNNIQNQSLYFPHIRSRLCYIMGSRVFSSTLLFLYLSFYIVVITLTWSLLSFLYKFIKSKRMKK